MKRASASHTAHSEARQKYAALSKEQLIERLLALEDCTPTSSPSNTKTPPNRPMDWSKWGVRKVAFKVAYLGWNYRGVALQADGVPTVERYFFDACRHTKLIAPEAAAADVDFSRCGRTDAGVSAFSQVFALRVRASAGGVNDEPSAAAGPLNYCKMLNGNLPADVRVVSWAFVADTFNARFDCTFRQYRYFFAHPSLNVSLMREALDTLVGEHDFKNLSRRDPSKPAGEVYNTRRTIVAAHIETTNERWNGFAVHCLVLRGTAFLYNQVRCIASVLLSVGLTFEPPSIFRDLTAVSASPFAAFKPDYEVACESPLILDDCGYENVQWMAAGDDAANSPLFTLRSFTHLYYESAVKATIINHCFRRLQAEEAVENADRSLPTWLPMRVPVDAQKYRTFHVRAQKACKNSQN